MRLPRLQTHACAPTLQPCELPSFSLQRSFSRATLCRPEAPPTRCAGWTCQSDCACDGFCHDEMTSEMKSKNGIFCLCGVLPGTTRSLQNKLQKSLAWNRCGADGCSSRCTGCPSHSGYHGHDSTPRNDADVHFPFPATSRLARTTSMCAGACMYSHRIVRAMGFDVQAARWELDPKHLHRRASLTSCQTSRRKTWPTTNLRKQTYE